MPGPPPGLPRLNGPYAYLVILPHRRRHQHGLEATLFLPTMHQRKGSFRHPRKRTQESFNSCWTTENMQTYLQCFFICFGDKSFSFWILKASSLFLSAERVWINNHFFRCASFPCFPFTKTHLLPRNCIHGLLLFMALRNCLRLSWNG